MKSKILLSLLLICILNCVKAQFSAPLAGKSTPGYAD